MSEEQTDYITEAGEPAAIIEQPRTRKVLRSGIDEEWTVAWVKLSTAFKPHIKEIRGAPLAVWLYISLSINKNGVAFPSINKIAEDTGYSRNGVMEAIKTLEEKGYLTVKRGERKYNLYEPEFAAIGKHNEPSNESTKWTGPVSEPDESTFSPNESSGVDLNKRNKNQPDNGANAPTPEMPIEWQIAGGVKTLALQDETAARRLDFANLVAMGTPNQEEARKIALAFQEARKIALPESKVKGQRKAIAEMLEMGVKAEHVRQAVRQLLQGGMTVTDLFSVAKTAISLANAQQPEQRRKFERLER